MNTAVMIYGRFQPVTVGHVKMFENYNTVVKKEKSYGYIFISPKVDHKDNPLSLDTRYNFLHKLYSDINFVADSEIKNPFDAVHFLGGRGYSKIILINF